MADKLFEITKFLGSISEEKGGWTKELNVVKWGSREPKYDIRAWDEDHEKMGKGVTLSEEELLALRDLLNKLFKD